MRFVKESTDMDPIRRDLLKTGAAVTALAAAPGLFAQRQQKHSGKSGFYEKGPVRIHYEEFGSGFPLLGIAGGGLSSVISGLSNPFDVIEEFQGTYRVVGIDMRNAKDGQSTGPIEAEKGWDMYTDDKLAVMDHLGIDKFAVIGFCIGGPFIWNLLKRAPDRVVAAVLAQPSGWRPELPTYNYDNNMKEWGPEVVKRRPEITMEQVDKLLTNMYRGSHADFAFSVTRDFVRNCQTPVLIMPDDIPAHPYTVAMEAAMLAPKSEVSMFPWNQPRERIPVAVRQIRSFLKAHCPATA
jgi:pimeloyl-ACP methyl ester carboxylesterase